MIKSNGKKVLESSECEAVFATAEHLVRYLTGFEAENGVAIVDKSGTTLYTDRRYIEAAEKILKGTDVTPTLFGKSGMEEIYERLRSYKSVGISFPETSHEQYLRLSEKVGENVFVNADKAFKQAMAVKNEWELSRIQKACEIAEDAFLALLPQIKEGMSETEVAALLEYNMRKLGAQGLSFATIVAFGAHAAVPHHETGETKLKFGDEILIDFGCRVDGYCSDITRTLLFGDDKKHEEFKKAYQCVLTAHELVKEKALSGMTGAEIDGIARDYLKANGYGELFTHSLGHGIGLNVHEFPSVSPKGETPLLDGMVFSDEPGVYVAGAYGIRIEDTVCLENGKIKSFMSKTDRNLIIL